jgi:hypothetical protein
MCELHSQQLQTLSALLGEAFPERGALQGVGELVGLPPGKVKYTPRQELCQLVARRLLNTMIS